MASTSSQAAAFAEWAAADRLVVTTNHNRPLRAVTDAQRIRAVLAALAEHTGEWEVPVDGVPVADVRLNFYAGERILGNVGVARAFLTLHHRGSFWSQRTGPEVYEALDGLLELKPPWIKK